MSKPGESVVFRASCLGKSGATIFSPKVRVKKWIKALFDLKERVCSTAFRDPCSIMPLFFSSSVKRAGVSALGLDISRGEICSFLTIIHEIKTMCKIRSFCMVLSE